MQSFDSQLEACQSGFGIGKDNARLPNWGLRATYDVHRVFMPSRALSVLEGAAKSSVMELLCLFNSCALISNGSLTGPSAGSAASDCEAREHCSSQMTKLSQGCSLDGL